MKRKAVFLDRDGTINKDIGYPNSFNQIEIYPYSFEAVRKLNRAGLLAVIVTNQSGVGRGFIQEKNLKEIHKKISDSFVKHNAYFDGIYHCPHYIFSKNPKYRKDCSCRKPFPGMGNKAAADLDIDTESSYMIGDKVEDMLFGLNIKAQPILVLTGFGETSLPELQKKGMEPVYIAPDLLNAVNWILEKEKKENSGKE